MGFKSSRWDTAEEKIHEREDIATETIQYNFGKRLREKKKKNRASVIHGTISSSVTHVLLESKMKKGRHRKNLLRIKGWKFSKLEEN